ncbi:MAG: YfhO family protein [Prevotellaceae bacterium]|jgi:hypothetical protein|nr:YfhO family protein [Prevotellaceae bacterium]
MNKKTFALIVPHVVAVVLFLIIAYVYCSPMLEGKVLQAHDTTSWRAMAHEIIEYNDSHDDVALWTNSMFGGMPAYQISVVQPNNLLQYVEKVISIFVSGPAFLIFLYLLCFYILALCFGINPYLSMVAAIAFSFSSYNEIIIAAGHTSKAITIAYVAPLIGSIYLAFRRNRWAGGILTALFLSLAIRANHVQILYYTIFILLFFVVVEFIFSIIEKKIPAFFKTSGLLIVAAIVAIGMNATSLLTTYEYSQYTMRGKSNGLTMDKQSSQQGLNSDYITQWSYGIGESLTTLIPNFRGGATRPVETSSETFKTIVAQTQNVDYANQLRAQALREYWGEQLLGTSGPVYFGAIVIFLFILGLIIVDKREKWWIVPMILLTLFLSWGKNFMFLTESFINHIPMYNKFRAPSMILVATGFGVALIAILALKKVFETKDKSTLPKPILIAAGVTGGLCLIFAVIPSLAGNFISSQEKEMFVGQFSFLQDTLSADRAKMLSDDSWRSLAFVLLGALVLLLYSKNLLKDKIAYILLGAFLLIDMIPIAKRYFGNDNFTTKRQMTIQIEPSPADKWIMDNDKSYYRVLDMSNGLSAIFNNSIPAHFHKNIGGYHAAKLRRYQELINIQLNREIGQMAAVFSRAFTLPQFQQTLDSLDVLNVLNMKYVIYDPASQPLINPYANGNAWFIDKVISANDANDEMTVLGKINTKIETVIDKSAFSEIPQVPVVRDTAATIELTEYQPNKLTYKVSTATPQVAVFSEIYYDKGWRAFIDGKESPYVRVDYLLRGMQLPAGDYQLQFVFHPNSYFAGNTIALICSIMLILCILGYAWYKFRRKEV